MNETNQSESSQSESNRTSDSDRSFVQESLARGEPMGWFDEVYARANGQAESVPWAHLAPRPAFAKWLEETQPQGDGQRALVIACGLGDDAQALAARGFAVTAFDVAPTAIQWAKERFPDSGIDFQVADMFQPPVDWVQGFDFVLEIFTVQALPIQLRQQAVAAVAQFPKPSGQLLVVTMGIPDDPSGDPTDGLINEDARPGPPWPLTRTELNFFKDNGLNEVDLREESSSSALASKLWRVLYQKLGS